MSKHNESYQNLTNQDETLGLKSNSDWMLPIVSSVKDILGVRSLVECGVELPRFAEIALSVVGGVIDTPVVDAEIERMDGRIR